MSVISHTSAKGRERTGVLLIHGLCGSPAEMRYLANGLEREGYVVRTPVLAGHGGSLDELKSTTWHDWLTSAEAALEELALTTDRIVVGGLSTGALLAMMLAAMHPDKVAALTLYSPTIWLNGRKVPWSIRIARRFLAFRQVARHFDLPSPQQYGIKDERIRAFLSAALAKSGSQIGAVTPGVTALERRLLAREVISKLALVAQPALIMHPREDCLADLDNAFYLQRNLPGRTELVVLEDSYHLITVDRQRQEVVDATLRFLTSIAKSASPTAATGFKTRNSTMKAIA
jgi:carboxylesterase